MKELGIDIAAQQMHQLTPAMVASADRVILVGPTPGGPLPGFLADSSNLEKWDIPDPGYEQIDHAAARDMIRERVEKLAKELA